MAEASYHRALEVASQHGSKFLSFDAATNLAWLWRNQDKRSEARDVLGPVYGWFTEGFDRSEGGERLPDELWS